MKFKAHNQTLFVSIPKGIDTIIILQNGVEYFVKPIAENEKKVHKINLVENAIYEIKNDFQTHELTPIFKNDLSFLRLPKKERNFEIQTCEVVLNREIKTPARIFKEAKKIEVNEVFLELPIQQQKFILLHECGHFIYETEHYCDLWALVQFCKKGYNYSQAILALNILKNNGFNEDRKNKIYNTILTNQKNGNR